MSEQDEVSRCKLCGEPMPEGEEMFFYHGYSGDCPKPPLPKPLAESSLRSQLIALSTKWRPSLSEDISGRDCEWPIEFERMATKRALRQCAEELDAILAVSKMASSCYVVGCRIIVKHDHVIGGPANGRKP